VSAHMLLAGSARPWEGTVWKNHLCVVPHGPAQIQHSSAGQGVRAQPRLVCNDAVPGPGIKRLEARVTLDSALL